MHRERPEDSPRRHTENVSQAVEDGILCAIIGLPRDAIGHVAAEIRRRDRLHVRVIDAEDGEAVKDLLANR